MLKLDVIKKEIEDFKTESSQINSNLEIEKEKNEKQLEDLKKDYNDKVKKVKTTFINKTQSMEKRLQTISDRKKILAGNIYIDFINNNLTQEQLNELTIMMKD